MGADLSAPDVCGVLRSGKAEIAENIGEVLGVSPAAAAAYLGQSMTAGEQAVLEELDDFDFEDI